MKYLSRRTRAIILVARDRGRFQAADLWGEEEFENSSIHTLHKYISRARRAGIIRRCDDMGVKQPAYYEMGGS